MRTTRRLRGFAEPSTSSQFEGYLQPGSYKVLEEKPGIGAARDTDYVRVLAPGLAESDSWICTRWRDQRYGELFDEAPRRDQPRIDWSDDPMAIPETALIELLPAFREYRYEPASARYPYAIAGVVLKQGPPKRNNCCTFVEALLVKAWQNQHADRAAWSSHLHRLMMILGDDLFGPISALLEAGMAVEVADVDAPPQPWTAIQGWTQSRTGHTFLILDYDAASDRVLTLESNSAYRLDGVGYRMLGNLDRFPYGRPPPRWFESSQLPTWDDIRARYTSRAMAILKVTNIGWVRNAAS